MGLLWVGDARVARDLGAGDDHHRGEIRMGGWIKFSFAGFVLYGIAMLFTHPTTVPTRATTPKAKAKPQPATA